MSAWVTPASVVLSRACRYHVTASSCAYRAAASSAELLAATTVSRASETGRAATRWRPTSFHPNAARRWSSAASTSAHRMWIRARRRPQHSVVHGISEQRVREAEVVDAVRLLHEALVRAALQSYERGVLVVSGHCGHDREREVLAEHRSGRERFPRHVVEGPHSSLDDAADRLRREFRDGRPGLELELAQQLAQSERVPGTHGHQLVELVEPLVSALDRRNRVDDRGDLVRIHVPEIDPEVRPGESTDRERLGERNALVDVVAERDHDHELAGRPPQNVAEHVEGVGLGPVEVLDDDEARPGRSGEDAGHRAEEALTAGRAVRRHRRLGQAADEIGRQPTEVAEEGRAALGRRCVGEERPDEGGEGLEAVTRIGVADPDQDRRSVGADAIGEVSDEGRLPDARLTGDEGELGRPVDGRGPRRPQRLELRCTAGEVGAPAGADRPSRGSRPAGGAGGIQLGSLEDDRLGQCHQRRGRWHPALGELGLGPLEERERLGLSSRAVQGEHESADERLADEVAVDDRLDEPTRLVGAVVVEERGRQPFPTVDPELLQAGDLFAERIELGEVHVGGSPPLGERRFVQRCGSRRRA